LQIYEHPFLFCGSAAQAGEVTLTGDANVESDLAGYKIHFGAQKRGEALGAIHAWCAAHEPTYDKCEAEWVAICTADELLDPAYHPALFKYDTLTQSIEPFSCI
jgi:hypothetical protein